MIVCRNGVLLRLKRPTDGKLSLLSLAANLTACDSRAFLLCYILTRRRAGSFIFNYRLQRFTVRLESCYFVLLPICVSTALKRGRKGRMHECVNSGKRVKSQHRQKRRVNLSRNNVCLTQSTRQSTRQPIENERHTRCSQSMG